MSSMSNYLENKLIDFLLRGVSFSPSSTLYVALCTSAPNDTSTGANIAEISGGNYARQSLSSNTTNWSTTNGDNASTSSGTGGSSSNSVEIKWTAVTWSGTVTHVAICDSLTGGNLLFYNALSANQTVASGDSISFGAGNLSLQIDN
jgi:hypothetical protein